MTLTIEEIGAAYDHCFEALDIARQLGLRTLERLLVMALAELCAAAASE